MVASGVAYFGRKDAQQGAVIRRLARDLNIPVRSSRCPTVPCPDGLAMSSRNAYLAPADRARALGLSRALAAAERAHAAGESDPAAIRAAAERELAEHEVEPDYIELVSPDTLAPVNALNGPVMVAVAARVGPARLIDNIVLGG